MSVDDIAKALQESGTPTAQKNVGKILIVEGYTLTQIAQAITDNTKTKKMIKHHLPQNNLWLL